MQVQVLFSPPNFRANAANDYILSVKQERHFDFLSPDSFAFGRMPKPTTSDRALIEKSKVVGSIPTIALAANIAQ